jgi:hypothetical protein
MALIAIVAVQAAFDVGLMIYRLLNRPKTPLPPLRDLQVMTGTNGAPIPFGYGTCRVAGNVIWTTGITYSAGGKKQALSRLFSGVDYGPKGSYVFTASLAVSFGEGPGVITRIWADSKLIYDANPGGTNTSPVSDWPAWSSTELYNPGNQVNFAGQVWQCIATNTNSAPSQSNRNWEIISIYPPWDVNTEYLSGDIVSFNGVLYIAQNATNNGTVGAINPASNQTFTVNGPNGSYTALYWIPLQQLYPPPTFYPGDEAQLPDSLIQASETEALTPAFRGLNYCVWDNLWLGNFADRIPSFRAEITYTRTTNLLSNYGVPTQVLAAASTSPATIPLAPLNSGDTIVITVGVPAGYAGGGGAISVSDSQGNVYNSVVSSGPLGRENSSVQILYAHASAGANTITVAAGASVSYEIYVLPGTWVPDYGGAWTDDLEGSTGSSTSGHSSQPGDFLAACFAAAYSQPNAIIGDNPLTEPPAVQITLNTPVGASTGAGTRIFVSAFGALPGAYPVGGGGFNVSDSWSFYFDNFGDGGAGCWATFKPPATLPPTAVTPKPDVLHDICERAGLTDPQIDNTLCAPVNIQTPLTPTNLVPGYLIDHPTPAAKILEVLMHAYFFDACETNGTMKFVPRGLPAALTIPEADLGLLSDMAKLEEQIAQEQDLPKQFTVTHNDPTLDFQQNKQLKGRNVRIVKTKQQTILEIPMTMTSDWARQVAVKALYLSWLERSSYKTNLWRASYLLLDPTDVIGFDYETLAFQMRVAENSIGQGRAVALQGVSEFSEVFNSAATGGAGLGLPNNAVQTLAPTLLFLFDIPLLRDVDSNPQNTGFYYALSSPSPTWNGGALLDSTDDVNFLQESTSSRPVTFGYATTVLGPPARSPWIWDNVNTVTIQLIRGTFAGDTPANVLNGSNAVIIGSELIQFTTAVHNADGSWTLSGLLRGRRGTEWACGTHAVGEQATVPGTGVQRIQDPLSIVGQLHYKKGVTAGADPTLVSPQNFTIAGNDLKPYAPVHMAGTRDGSHNLTIAWVRRTRVGWMNLSQDPVPLSESSEAYSVDILNGSTVVRTIAASSPTASYSAADQTTDFGSPQASVSIKVYQLSAQVGRGFAGAAAV